MEIPKTVDSAHSRVKVPINRKAPRANGLGESDKKKKKKKKKKNYDTAIYLLSSFLKNSVITQSKLNKPLLELKLFFVKEIRADSTIFLVYQSFILMTILALLQSILWSKLNTCWNTALLEVKFLT